MIGACWGLCFGVVFRVSCGFCGFALDFFVFCICSGVVLILVT